MKCKNCKKWLPDKQGLCWICYLDLKNKDYYKRKESERQYQKWEIERNYKKQIWEKNKIVPIIKKENKFKKFIRKFQRLFKINKNKNFQKNSGR